MDEIGRVEHEKGENVRRVAGGLYHWGRGGVISSDKSVSSSEKRGEGRGFESHSCYICYERY
jgi:hypothetical protein